MSKNNKIKWWIDAIMFAGFLLAFFMDLTGLELHQWLGVSVGILILYHLLTHLDWVNVVADRFFGETSNRSRIYLLIDIAIVCGFAFILGTGLLMSTWFEINLVNYDFWYLFHLLFSMGTLILVSLKLTLHWRWIASVIRKPKPMRLANPIQPTPVQTPVAAPRVGRREFLGVIGVVGIGTLVAANSVMKSLRLIQGSQSTALAQTLPTVTQAATANSTGSSTSLPVNEVTPTVAPTATTSPATSTSNVACVVRCNHHCSYPGRCHRYIDSNSNSLCDNGECM